MIASTALEHTFSSSRCLVFHHSRESRRTLRPPWYRASSVEQGYPLRTLHNEVLDLCDLLLPTAEEKLKT